MVTATCTYRIYRMYGVSANSASVGKSRYLVCRPGVPGSKIFLACEVDQGLFIISTKFDIHITTVWHVTPQPPMRLYLQIGLKSLNSSLDFSSWRAWFENISCVWSRSRFILHVCKVWNSYNNCATSHTGSPHETVSSMWHTTAPKTWHPRGQILHVGHQNYTMLLNNSHCQVPMSPEKIAIAHELKKIRVRGE